MKKESIQNNINFEELSQAVKDKRLESQEFADFSDREVLKHILKEKHKDVVSQDFNGQHNEEVSSDKNSNTFDNNDDMLPEYAKDSKEEEKQIVFNLIKLTFKKGLSAGFRAAKKNDPFIIDMYHDALSDRLMNEIKNRKFI